MNYSKKLEDYLHTSGKNDLCQKGHIFYRNFSGVKCVVCELQIKEHQINKETKGKYKFNDLIKVIINKGQLIDIDPIELPFIKVQIANLRKQNLTGSDFIKELYKLLNIAYLNSTIDYKETVDFLNEKYITFSEAQNIINEIVQKILKLKDYQGKCKNLILEEYLTILNEILILLGYPIDLLYKETKDINAKYALAKAYYHLSDEYFKIESNYFNHDEEKAKEFNCLTTNKEINKMILQMQLKKNK